MAKFNEIGYQVCKSSSIGRYEYIQNPERQNPAIAGIWENLENLAMLKPVENYLRNHFWPLESGFTAIATYNT